MTTTRPCVAVSGALPERGVVRLGEVADVALWKGDAAPSPAEAAALAAQAEALVAIGVRVDAALLDACPRLRVVTNVAVGYDNLDVAELTRRRIPAGNTPGVLTAATAELAFTLILAASRRVREGMEVVRQRTWPSRMSFDFLLGGELAGARLGVVGAGRIGQAVIKRALGFEMEVVAWSRTPPELPGAQALGLDELLATSDVVSLHVALAEGTRHLIGRRELGLMKPTAILVNTARGAVVDQQALYEALAGGQIAGAGLDVLEAEPPLPDDPLLDLPNCLILPHVGSATATARAAMVDLAVDNVLAGLAGERLPACINPEVYPAGSG